MQRQPFRITLIVLALAAVAGLAVGFASGNGVSFVVAGVAAFLLVLHAAYGPDEAATPARRATRATTPPRPAPRTATTRAARPAPATAPTPKPTPLSAPAPTATPVAEAANGYRPQCVALTAAGVQCRSSARGGSRYCSSHFGYQPRTPEGVVRTTDTESKVARRDTVTSFAGDATAVTTRGAQCQALTAGDLQCKNTVRAGSQFCVRHRGYRSPTPGAFVASRDTAPRVRGAPNTTPSVRRRAGSSQPS